VPLSDLEFGLLQQNIDAIVEKIATLNLNMSIETDFYELYRFLKFHTDTFIYPTFDPHMSDVSRGSFWIRLIDDQGLTVATAAEKVFETDDFFTLMESGQLWFRKGMPAAERPQLDVKRPSTKLTGKIGHAGSFWVAPRWRGKGLSLYLPYLRRSLSLRNYTTDFHTCLVFKGLAHSRVPRSYYGYPHVELCLSGFFPPTGKHEDVYICYISAEESIDQIREVAHHPEFPIPDPDLLDSEVLKQPLVGAYHQ